MSNIKVAYIVSSINTGGGARNIRTFAKYAPKKIAVHVVTYATKGEKYYDFKKVFKDLHFVNKSIKKTLRYITDRKINVLHFTGNGVFNDFELNLAIKAKDLGLKIVYTNIFGNYCKQTDSLVDYYIFKSNHCFVVKYTKNANLDLQKIKISDRYVVIPNPIDVKNFNFIRPTNKEVLNYKNNLKIPKHNIVIGKIGAREAVEKWSDLILYMFPLVLKKHPNITLLIQGLPKSRKKWVSRFKDSVILLPQTTSDKELSLMYNCLDIFTHASKIGEHSGNSINEAMFWGKPVVVNLTPNKDNGQLEQVLPGVNGYFASNPTEYSMYVNKLIYNKADRLKYGQQAIEFVLQRNEPKTLWRSLSSVYLFLLSKNKQKPLITSEQSISAYNSSYKNKLHSLYNPFKKTKKMFNRVYWKIRDYFESNY